MSKLVQIGEKMGLSGDKLYEFVNDKEQALRKKEEDRIAREERAAEREAKRIEQELNWQMSVKESQTKVTLLEKQIELEKVKSEALALEFGPRQDIIPSGQGASSQSRAKMPKLPSFNDEKDCIDAYLHRFERFADNAKWSRDT